jgi:nitroimidazol reductase NimA-like FMN-containing flavoprotein (pyridoxamine 5'-phosphate oxidase superfamily)
MEANRIGVRKLDYTQPPPLTKGEIESFLKEARTARFCSLNKDGTIHAAPVLFRHENGQIIIITPEASQKAKNVKRNGKVSILIDTEQSPPRGVLIYGNAELRYPRTRDEYLVEATRLYEKYMPRKRAERMAQGMYRITRGVEIIVKPEHIVSFDYGKDTVYPTA